MGVSHSFDQTFQHYLNESKINNKKYSLEYNNNESLFLKRDFYFKNNNNNNSNSNFMNNKDEDDLEIIKGIISYQSGKRTYMAYIPQQITKYIPQDNITNIKKIIFPQHMNNSKNNNSHSTTTKVPLIICLHGTDETAFDSELVEQVKGGMSWMDVSDFNNSVIVFPQARGQRGHLNNSWRKEGDFLRTLWLLSFVESSKSDHHFIQAVYNDICNLVPIIDSSSVYIVGFSNGGFMAADLVLNLDSLSFTPKAVCCYMGGLEELQVQELGLVAEQLPAPPELQLDTGPDSSIPALYVPYGAVDTPKPIHPSNLPLLCLPIASHPNKPKILIVTGELDVQLSSCCRAWEIFSFLGYQTDLYIMKNTEHEYIFKSTEVIWKFFTNEPLFS